MADFHQRAAIATLHRLNPDGAERLERELVEVAAEHPMGLVLPALYTEFETPAMLGIRNQLADAPYPASISSLRITAAISTTARSQTASCTR